MGSDTDEDKSGRPIYNQRALVKCDASYLGSEVPTLTTQPPGIIHQPLTIICSKREPPTQSDTVYRHVRLNVFHSSIIIEILYGEESGKCVNYPIQNLYCSAALLPHKDDKSADFQFLTLEQGNEDRKLFRPIFAVVMRETVNKRVLRCHAFAVVNKQVAGLLVKATALAFKEKRGWNQPLLEEKFSNANFIQSLALHNDYVSSISVNDDEHISRISLGTDESTDCEQHQDTWGNQSHPIFNTSSTQYNQTYIPSDMHHTTLVPSPSPSSSSWSTRSSRKLNSTRSIIKKDSGSDMLTSATNLLSGSSLSHRSYSSHHPLQSARTKAGSTTVHAPSDTHNHLSLQRSSRQDNNANWYGENLTNLLQHTSLDYPVTNVQVHSGLHQNYEYDGMPTASSRSDDRLEVDYHPDQFMYGDTLKYYSASRSQPMQSHLEASPLPGFKPKTPIAVTLDYRRAPKYTISKTDSGKKKKRRAIDRQLL